MLTEAARRGELQDGLETGNIVHMLLQCTTQILIKRYICIIFLHILYIKHICVVRVMRVTEFGPQLLFRIRNIRYIFGKKKISVHPLCKYPIYVLCMYIRVGPDLVFLAGCRMSGACQIRPDIRQNGKSGRISGPTLVFVYIYLYL